MRLRRGRQVLIAMGVILGLIDVSSLITIIPRLPDPRTQLPVIIIGFIQILIPLALLFAIWRGRNFARVLLGLGCAIVLLLNIRFINQLPLMWKSGDEVEGISIAFTLVGCLIVGLLALFSPALAALAVYRQEERDMQ
jgi:hypothetical protein